MTANATHHSPSGRVLVVCTGNVCRSPYIERVLAHQLNGSGVTVTSAGTGALVGYPIDPESARRVAAAGASPDGFAARQISREDIAAADLVIAASREHVDEVVALNPRALRSAFSLPDLADLLAAATYDDVVSAPGANRVAKVAATAVRMRGRVHPRPLSASGIVDPFRQKPEVIDRMVHEIEATLPIVVSALRG
ncbi:protein tyrosine phosphatase [Knoellia sinensis KCTC 19936]|uniref:protein-tyrosine-phosphatase n=1 Tax=Knoellia sinensis KCTC 19936 TaxID=1385520 RepID=A0A0A0JBK1_9MICO|nr:low molecular weight phosphatase family protein [Knoellia sinensis]KGN32986.1 protein tyrosine phosphatase [Knoellia sinensis KCTC 19936]